MSRTALSHHLVKFQQDEEKMVLSATDDSDRETMMEWYHKSKIVTEDMLRQYTPAEVRELCERTKVRVKMYDMNAVWDAKRRLIKEERVENRSESWVNRMLVKADSRKWVLPYSKLEKDKYKDLAACQTKKDNNMRLDRWHRQRAKAAKSSDVEHRAESSSSSASRSKPAESQTQECPESNLLVEQSPAALESQPQAEVDEAPMEQAPAMLESQPQAEVDETTMEQAPATSESQPQAEVDETTMEQAPTTLESQPQAEVDDTTMEQAPTTLESQPQAEVDDTTMEQAPAALESQPQAEVGEAPMEQAPATSESQPQAEVDETTMEQAPTTLESKSKSAKGTMDENIQPVLQRRSNSDSEPNLLGWDMGGQDEVEESAAEAGNDMQPDGPMVAFDWLNFVENIHSESLSLPNTQDLDESDDEPFL